MPMQVIKTAAFTLEPQTVAHAEEMFLVLSDPAIYEYENEPPPSLEWLRARFAKLESRLSADSQEQYEVVFLSATLKRENVRSLRLLERLGFALASPEQRVEHRVEPGELLMRREVHRA